MTRNQETLHRRACPPGQCAARSRAGNSRSWPPWCWPARRCCCARTGAFAAAKELVLVNWGGDAITAYDAAYGQAFTKDTGITVKMDGSGPTEGAIAAQFKSGAPTWDLVDVDPFSAHHARRAGHARADRL